MSKVIGITGIFGSGKTTVSSILKNKGFPVISSDEIVHQLLKRKDIKDSVTKEFGKDILDENGEISRKRLGEIVFYDSNKMKRLEEIIHPEVFKEINRIILDYKKKKSKIIFVEIPLLFETKAESFFDKVIVVYAHPSVIKKRLQSKFSDEEIERRWRYQIPQEVKKEKADFVIDNSYSFQKTEKQVEKILEILCCN
ncbi:MAG: dephospho-CoA kinase [Candidatus Omnitrophota bacterium]|nr:MAG: dephospho-CoA kinase [Candidatus Omnitrophota bacterium]